MNAVHPMWARFMAMGAELVERDPERFARWVELLELASPDATSTDPLLVLVGDVFGCSLPGHCDAESALAVVVVDDEPQRIEPFSTTALARCFVYGYNDGAFRDPENAEAYLWPVDRDDILDHDILNRCAAFVREYLVAEASQGDVLDCSDPGAEDDRR